MEEQESLSTCNGKATLEYVKPNFEVHTFVSDITENIICFQVLKLENSLFIWIGSQDVCFTDLSMAVNTNYGSLPLATRLMGDHSDLALSNLASRLTKRLGKLVYLSYNVPSNRIFLPQVEKRLQEEIKKYPEKFA